MAKKPAFSPQERALLTDRGGRQIGLPTAAHGLTEKQVLFARYVSLGLSYTAAIKAAGYQPSNDATAKVMGSQLASDERVSELIKVFTAAMLRSSGPAALKTLNDVLADPKAKSGDRIKAAKIVLDKSQATKVSHEVQGEITHHVEHEQARSLADLYAEAGIEPPDQRRLPSSDVVDAEFEVLEPAPADTAPDGQPW